MFLLYPGSSAVLARINLGYEFSSATGHGRLSHVNLRSFSATSFERVISEQHLPTAQEQADNLVQHIGEQLQSRQDPGGEAPFAPDELVATIGCFDRGGIWYLADELEKSGLLFFPLRRGVNEPMGPPVRVPPPSERYATIGSVRLTFEGWKRFSELQKAHSEGPIAFMAMPFGDPLLDRMFAGNRGLWFVN